MQLINQLAEYNKINLFNTIAQIVIKTNCIFTKIRQMSQNELILDEIGIKNILKKYDISHKQSILLKKLLQNRKIHRKSFRSIIINQDDKTSKLYCLLSGSVKISCKFLQDSIIKDSVKGQQILSRKFNAYQQPQKQIITVLTIDREYEMINQQILLESWQRQKYYNYNSVLQNTNQIKQENGQMQSSFFLKKNNNFKSKFTITVTSSQCKYLKLTLQEGSILLRNRIEQIKQKVFYQERFIKSKMMQIQNQRKNHDKQDFFEKLSLPNLNLKNIHQANQAFQINNKLLKSISLQKEHQAHKRQIFLKQKQIKVSKYGERISTHGSSIQLKSLAASPKSKLNQKISAVLDGNLNKYKEDSSLFQQNQQILQRYRSGKGAYFTGKKPGLQRSSLKAGSSRQLHQNQEDKQLLFKEHLKKIIKKKLNYQKKHGQILKEFINGQKVEVSKKDKINNEKILPNKLDKQKQPKRSNSHRQFGIKLKNVKTKFNSFGGNQHSEKLLRLKKPLMSRNSSLTKIGVLSSNMSNLKNTVSSNRLLNLSPRDSPIRSPKVKKLKDEKLFLQLQELDNYFTKLQ